MYWLTNDRSSDSNIDSVSSSISFGRQRQQEAAAMPASAAAAQRGSGRAGTLSSGHSRVFHCLAWSSIGSGDLALMYSTSVWEESSDKAEGGTSGDVAAAPSAAGGDASCECSEKCTGRRENVRKRCGHGFAWRSQMPFGRGRMLTFSAFCGQHASLLALSYLWEQWAEPEKNSGATAAASIGGATAASIGGAGSYAESLPVGLVLTCRGGPAQPQHLRLRVRKQGARKSRVA